MTRDATLSRVAAFYQRLGFDEHFRLPGEDGLGERVAFLRDPEGNVVTLAMPAH